MTCAHSASRLFTTRAASSASPPENLHEPGEEEDLEDRSPQEERPQGAGLEEPEEGQSRPQEGQEGVSQEGRRAPKKTAPKKAAPKKAEAKKAEAKKAEAKKADAKKTTAKKAPKKKKKTARGNRRAPKAPTTFSEDLRPEPLAPPRTGLGAKYTCFECGAKFYDLNKPDPVCPKCNADQRDAPRQPARPRPAPLPPPEPEPEREQPRGKRRTRLLDEDEQEVVIEEEEGLEIGLGVVDEPEDFDEEEAESEATPDAEETPPSTSA
jgi:hypothetical protein